MTDSSNSASGIKRMLDKYRKEFRCSENTEHYNEHDYMEAERKYIKFRLGGDPAS